MYEKIVDCPCCNSKDFINYTICDDHSVSGESFAIVQCKNCELLLTSPRPDKSSITPYYRSEHYISHTNRANSPINVVYKLVRKLALQAKFKLVNQYAAKQSILDIGCGTGDFINLFTKNGWKAFGVEPDTNARANTHSKYNVGFFETLREVPKQKFDIITLWHVLEHVHDLSETLAQINQRLSKKGTLFVAVPNHDSYDRKFYKEYWAAYDVPRHLYHFNQLTIKNLMKYHGFDLVDIKPMKYDAYYVSLLSEGYKKNKTKYFKSIIIGWLSNRFARKNNNNFSSLIYLFKKA